MADQLEEILKKKDINPTAVRLMVLNHFLSKNSALTLSDLENDFDYSDRTTLFRTLKTFEKKGLLHSIIEGNTTSYALCVDKCSEEEHADQHMHFCCTECKKIYCLPAVQIPQINIPTDFKLEKADIILHGLCRECNIEVLKK